MVLMIISREPRAVTLQLVPRKITSSYRVTSDDFDEYMSTPKLDPFLQEKPQKPHTGDIRKNRAEKF